MKRFTKLFYGSPPAASWLLLSYGRVIPAATGSFSHFRLPSLPSQKTKLLPFRRNAIRRKLFSRRIKNFKQQTSPPAAVKARYEKMLEQAQEDAKALAFLANYRRALTHPDGEDLQGLEKAVRFLL